MIAVGGSLRRALGNEMAAVAATWPICEVVPESWDPDDAADTAILERLADATTVALHTLSLNPLGDGPAPWALERIRSWAGRLRITSISDHFAWTGAAGIDLGIFVPPPRDVTDLVDRIERQRAAVGLPLVLENVAVPLSWDEVRGYHECLVETCRRAAVPILLDLENVRLDAEGDTARVHELLAFYETADVTGYHVAGSDVVERIDTHDQRVSDATLAVLQTCLRRKCCPVIYERDHALGVSLIADEVTNISSRVRANDATQSGTRHDPESI